MNQACVGSYQSFPILQPDIVMDEDDPKDGSKEEEEEEEAVDPLEEHEKRLRLAREQKEKETGDEPNKTEEKD